MSEINDTISDSDARSAFDSRVQEIGKGRCKVCGMYKMAQAGRWICPNCNTKTNANSGLVNDLKDPGHDAMEQILKSTGAAKMEPKTLEIDNRKVSEFTPELIIIKIDLETLENLDELSFVNTMKYRIAEALDNLPMPSTIKEAKRIIKLQEKFVGGQ